MQKVLVEKSRPLGAADFAKKIKKESKRTKAGTVVLAYSKFDDYVKVQRNKILRKLKGIANALERNAVYTTCGFPFYIYDWSRGEDRKQFKTKGFVDSNGNDVLKAYKLLQREFAKAGYKVNLEIEEPDGKWDTQSETFTIRLTILGLK